MGIVDTLKGVLKTIKKHVVYECEDCDFEGPKKNFDTSGNDIACPRCGSTRVYVDD